MKGYEHLTKGDTVYVKCLSRRLLHLEKRVHDSPRTLSFDVQEAKALRWVLGVVANREIGDVDMER